MSLFIYGDETGPLRGMDVTVGDLQIIVDRVTGVQCITVVGKGGICPRVDSSGRPMVLSRQEIDQLVNSRDPNPFGYI